MTRAELLTLVPARGGSKGLPGKNARTLGDRPLLGWTAEFVRASGVPARLVLSTDDPQLADLGKSVGLEVPFLRPAELATDEATSLAVVEHALDWFAERGIELSVVALLQPTSPFRPAGVLAEAMQLIAAGAPAVVGVKDLHRATSSLYRANADRTLTRLGGGDGGTRRQDARPLLTPNGALYVTTTAALRSARTFVPDGTIGIVMDQIASIDIDDATDWALAEAVVAAGLRGGRR
jgi:N-acylneuraminate cytidylyltransferase/CMP-N,N'-diacetyllegionaminic acid synthase